MIAVDVRDFCIPSDENDYDKLVAFADTMASIPRFDVVPIEVLDEIRGEVVNLTGGDIPERIWNVDVLEILDKYKTKQRVNVFKVVDNYKALGVEPDESEGSDETCD